MNKEIPQMWTIRESMQKTGISRFLIMTLIESGKIIYVKTGRKYLINAESLCNYLTNGENNVKNEA